VEVTSVCFIRLLRLFSFPSCPKNTHLKKGELMIRVHRHRSVKLMEPSRATTTYMQILHASTQNPVKSWLDPPKVSSVRRIAGEMTPWDDKSSTSGLDIFSLFLEQVTSILQAFKYRSTEKLEVVKIRDACLMLMLGTYRQFDTRFTTRIWIDEREKRKKREKRICHSPCP
jgi:hypothetical protein